MEEARTEQDVGIQSPPDQKQGQESGSTSTETELAAIELDPAGEYLIGKDNTPMLGAQVMNAIGRGELASRLQSQVDQLQAQMEQYQEVELENAQLQQQLEEAENDRKLRELVSDRLPSAPPPAPAPMPAEDMLYTGEVARTPAPAPQLNTDEIAKTIEDITGQVTDERIGQSMEGVQEMITQMVQEELGKQAQQRAIQDRNARLANNLRETKVSSFMADYGYSSEDAQRAAGMEVQAQVLENEAKELFAQGYDEEAANKYEAATSIRHKVTYENAQQLRAYEDQKQKEALKSQLESGNFTAMGPPPEEPRKRNWKAQDVRKARDERRRQVASRLQAELTAKGALGPGVRGA